MLRLFHIHRPRVDLSECDHSRCHQPEVPQVEPDPDKERMRAAVHKLDIDVDLLRRVDREPETD